MPRRLVSILEGEALVNDATALVAYRIAVTAATGAVAFSLLDAGWEFLWKAAGGIAVGLAVGWVIAQVRRRLDDPLLENTIGLLSGYAAYVPAEHLHALRGARRGDRRLLRRLAGAEDRLARRRGCRASACGSCSQFLMNAFLFILIGLQLPQILDALDTTDVATLLGYAAAVSAAVVLTRLVWQHTTVFVVRALDRRESAARAARRAGRARTVIGWAGMRGAVSLAAALALPPDFPQRDLIIFLTFAVIFVTLVLQGLTLPPLIRWLGVRDDGTEEEREELKARLVATKAALARIDELAERGVDARRHDRADARRCTSTASGGWRRARARSRTTASRTARSPTRRSCARCWRRSAREIVRLRNEGTISNDVMHRIERELDLEDERLEI